MEYTVRQNMTIIHAIQFDGTRKGIDKINQFLIVNEQDTAVATPLDCCTDKTHVYCNIGYMDPNEPRYYFMSPFEYFVLRDDGTRFIIPGTVFEEIYQTGAE